MEYVEARLADWGRWCCRQEAGVAGYPRQTILGRLRTEGGVLSRAQGASAVPMDSGAEQVERVVTRLRSVRQEWADVLRKRYVDGLTVRQIACDIHASLGATHLMLSSAKGWIGGAIESV
ncbi:MAG: hypothetical protein GY788_07330 [bacterium]|nr:hypothetical protein [bacterium]